MKVTRLGSRLAAYGSRHVSGALALCALAFTLVKDVETAPLAGLKTSLGLESRAQSHLISSLPGFEGDFPSRHFGGGAPLRSFSSDFGV